MTRLRYTPGSWRAVVTPGGVAMLPSGVDAEMLESIWSSLDAGNGLGAVLESLTGAFGTSLRSIPPFAVATVSGAEVRLAVRGELAIEVDEGDVDGSPLVVSGADVTTWSERVVASARSVTLRAPAAARANDADWFPIASGVVLAGAVTAQLEEDAPTSALRVSAPEQTVDAERAGAASAPAASEVSVASEAPAMTEDSGAGLPVETRIPEETILPDEGADAGATAEADGSDSAAGRDAEAEPDAKIQRDKGAGPGAEIEPDSAAEPHAELEFTRDELPDDAYDHLWGATVVKRVEEAAVRDTGDDDDEDPEPLASPPVVAPAEAPPTPSTPAPADPGGFAPPAAPAAASPAVPQNSGLIDSVPNFGGVGASSASDSLVGRTVPPTSMASTPATPATAPTVAAPAIGDDHDGLTVTVSELEAMRRLGAAQASAPEPPASALGRIVLSTGETHPLDRPVIIGRRPRANRVQADQVPVLITVASPEQDISRNHLEVRLEGRHVLVVDLATTNGSVLHREGTPPLRLGPNEPVLVLSGDVVDIGDGVTVSFEEIP